MKDFLTEAIANKLPSTMESIGGAKALYGDPITFNGEEIIPVARIAVTLSAGADGSGGGKSGLGGGISNMATGGGGGKADSSVQIAIDPVGFLKSTPKGPVFCPLDPE